MVSLACLFPCLVFDWDDKEIRRGDFGTAVDRMPMAAVPGLLTELCEQWLSLHLAAGVSLTVSDRSALAEIMIRILFWSGQGLTAWPSLTSNLKSPCLWVLTHRSADFLRIPASFTNSSRDDVFHESETGLSLPGDAVLWHRHGWVDLKPTRGVVEKH